MEKKLCERLLREFWYEEPLIYSDDVKESAWQEFREVCFFRPEDCSED